MPSAVTDIWNALLVHPLITLLVAFYDVVHDFGLAIVLVTILIRLLLYPLFVTQIRNQRAMAELAPAMNELKAKYGNDRQRLSQEQMKLYQERGYNPAMGCLPLLLQMPLLIALYAAFTQAPTLDGNALQGILPPFIPNPLGPDQHLDLTAHWLPWLTSLGDPSNPLAPVPPLERVALAILPLLAGGLQLVSSVMFQPAVPPKNVDQQQKMMQSMSYYFPLLTIYFATQFPAGLAVYWVTTTAFGIVQQYFVSGWGRLPHFLPFLAAIPSPADRTLAARQQAALEEERRDMARAPVGTNGPGAQNTREARRNRNRNKKKK
jgi:YidC/Oxa1 family membrane protein insertase